MKSWKDDKIVKQWDKLKKKRVSILIQSWTIVTVGVICYLTGWALLGIPQLLIAAGIPLFLLGAAALYGQEVSSISINPKSRN